jgi:hypothetical protein
MPPLIALSDAQLDTLFRLSAPLAVVDRTPFFEAVVSKLAENPELLGDGHVARIALEVQKKFWVPPDLSTCPAKYGR